MTTALLDTAALRRIEAQMHTELGAGVLMARAGAAAAAWVMARWPHRGTPILIVCGPGNNGGDGFACALALAEAGYCPTVAALAPSTATDAQHLRARWAATHTVLTELPALEGYTLIIDALFGVGLTRALSGAFLAAAQAIGRSRAHVLALDCPSGLDAERGAWVQGEPGVHAHTTLTFIGAKPGLLTGLAVDACGEVLVDALGIAVDALVQPAARLNAPSEFAHVVQPRRRDTHKGSFGAVAVVGGNVSMVGAALLAARAALRLGAGRVFVDAIGAPQMSVDPMQPEVMFRAAERLKSVDAVVLGCGLGQDDTARRAYSSARALGAPCVLDADALALMGRAPSPTAVITPHPLEAARLLGCTAAQVQADRIDAARQLAAQTRSVVVLKGAGTVIAAGERIWINPTGSPALATAGTGDVLAGMIGAFMAQKFSPLESALAATWLHGAAAQSQGVDVGLVASDLPTLAAQQLAQLRSAHQCLLIRHQ